MDQGKHIGKAIRFVRLSQGLGQEEVAQAAGVSSGFVSLIELGSRDPSWEVILKLTDALGVTLTLLAMLMESEEPFVQPIISLAYNELARVNREKDTNHV